MANDIGHETLDGSSVAGSLFNYSGTGGPIGTEFLSETLLSSLATSILLVLGGILLILFGIILKRKEELRKVRIPSLVAGVIFIVAEILWLILVPALFPIQKFLAHLGAPPPGITYGFWNMSSMGINIPIHSVSFGIIGGFLAAAVAFIGAGVAHYYSKERKVKIPGKKEVMPPTKEPSPPVKADFNTCPECGAIIEDPEKKFCGNCGFEFKLP